MMACAFVCAAAPSSSSSLFTGSSLFTCNRNDRTSCTPPTKRPRSPFCPAPYDHHYHHYQSRAFSHITSCNSVHNQNDSISTSTATPTTRKERARDFLKSTILSGFDPSPELFAIMSAYFVQGALGISRLAISFFLKDDLHLSPAQASALTGLSMLPWLIKPLYGFLTDSLPIFKLRRQPYLITSAFIGTLAWTSLSSFVYNVPTATIATMFASLSVAFTDVVVDSIVVERSRKLPSSKAGGLQSLCWGVSAFGGLLSAYLSGYLLQTIGARGIFKLTAVLPLITGCLAINIKEKKVEQSVRLKQLPTIFKSKSSRLFKALKTRSVFLPALFIFLWQGTPCPDASLFYFQTNVLNFGPEFLGRVRLTSSIASLTGITVFNVFLKDKPMKSIMKWATLISVPLSLAQVVLVTRVNVELGIPDKLFALADSAVLTVLGQIAFMPVLVLAARMCPPGVEGTLFAALMSVFNASSVTANELGALLTTGLGVTEKDFGNLPILVTICSLAYLLPLPLLNLLDNAPVGKIDGDGDDGHAIVDVDALEGGLINKSTLGATAGGTVVSKKE